MFSSCFHSYITVSNNTFITQSWQFRPIKTQHQHLGTELVRQRCNIAALTQLLLRLLRFSHFSWKLTAPVKREGGEGRTGVRLRGWVWEKEGRRGGGGRDLGIRRYSVRMKDDRLLVAPTGLTGGWRSNPTKCRSLRVTTHWERCTETETRHARTQAWAFTKTFTCTAGVQHTNKKQEWYKEYTC